VSSRFKTPLGSTEDRYFHETFPSDSSPWLVPSSSVLPRNTHHASRVTFDEIGADFVKFVQRFGRQSG